MSEICAVFLRQVKGSFREGAGISAKDSLGGESLAFLCPAADEQEAFCMVYTIGRIRQNDRLFAAGIE